MKTLYYMAVCKPRQSRTWLPMLVGCDWDIHILRQTAAVCERDAAPYLTDEWVRQTSPRNKFRNASEWHIKAARVSIENEAGARDGG